MNNEKVLVDYLSEAHEKGDENVSLLYKYRPCEPHHIKCLTDDTLWFSSQDQLNDPFDCLTRIPESLGASDISEIRRNLTNAQPYQANISTASEALKYMSEAPEIPALIPLGLMAAQLSHDRLLSHIKEIHKDSDQWITELFFMAREIAEIQIGNIAIFCLCQPRDHQLMWAHYAASHTGFCTGYVSPTGTNPRIIHQVNYTNKLPKISPWNLIDDPGKVSNDLTQTKSSEWSYESEWRILFSNMSGLNSNVLPYKEVILGSKISSANEEQIRQAIKGRDVNLYRATIKTDTDHYKIGIEPA